MNWLRVFMEVFFTSMIFIGVVGFCRALRLLPAFFDESSAFASMMGVYALIRLVYLQRVVIETMNEIRQLLRPETKPPTKGGTDGDGR